jgi:hypothetical protein
MRRERLFSCACALALAACADDEPPPPPPEPIVATVGPGDPPMAGFDDPERPPPPDLPDDDVTTGVDPGVTTPGVTTIDPGVTTVDTIGPPPPGPPTGTEGPCFSVCDCPPGLSCLEGFCQATVAIRWCCTDAGCPAGTRCETPEGRLALCPGP